MSPDPRTIQPQYKHRTGPRFLINVNGGALPASQARAGSGHSVDGVRFDDRGGRLGINKADEAGKAGVPKPGNQTGRFQSAFKTGQFRIDGRLYRPKSPKTLGSGLSGRLWLAKGFGL